MDKKYKLLEDETIKFEGRTLYRIQALKDFGSVEKDQKGGYIQSEYNLSHEGNCWIHDNAVAMDRSRVLDDATMFDNASMHDSASMYDSTEMHNHTSMHDFTEMHDNTLMYNYASMHDFTEMHDNTLMYNYASMYDNASIHDCSRMYDHSRMYDDSEMTGESIIKNDVCLSANIQSTILESNNDFIEFDSIGEFRRTIIYLKKEKLINVNNCFVGNVDELEEKVLRKYKHKKTNYKDVIRMVRALEQ